ncbi:MAG: polymer-forming cytoskeletal protein [Proteobacteria bacterium]|nr:polymer-forming cytoskeletal protein [Pseudomonadota bacterium]
MKRNDPNDISGLLGAGSRFEGEIKFDGTLRIDGAVFGQIISKSDKPSTVIITEMAVVEADIIADSVVISGTVSGNIKAIEKLELYAPGRLEGLVYTSDFSIDNGALFQGECVMIRHLSFEDKRALKMEGFYTIHHRRLIGQGNKTIHESSDDSTVIEI